MFQEHNNERKGFKSDIISVYLKLEGKQINNLQSNQNATLKCLWSSIVARKEKQNAKENQELHFIIKKKTASIQKKCLFILCIDAVQAKTSIY